MGPSVGIAADFVLIVVAGFIGAIAARALGLPLLVGYVAAGVAVGPHTAGPTVANLEDIELLAEIGVALLLFALGLEVSFRDLRAVRGIALIGGPLQIVVAAGFGTWIARLAGVPPGDALWFGAMVSLSSTMVVLKTLAATGTMSTLASRVMIGMLVVQDLAVVPILIVLPQLGASDGMGGRLLQASLIAGAFLLVMVVAGTRLLPMMLRRVVGWGSRELFLVAVVAAGVGVGAIAHRFGLSFAIGAFIAGVILSESELSHQALSDVTPLRDIFGLLFFVSVGMLFDPAYVIAHAGLVAALVAAIVAGKSLIVGLIARAFGYRNMAPWIIGLGLSQIGEFSFVLARTGRAGHFITAETYDLALTCTVLSMALSPLVFPGLLPVARAVSRRLRPGAGGRPAAAAHDPREPRRSGGVWPHRPRRRGRPAGVRAAVPHRRDAPRDARPPARAGRAGDLGRHRARRHPHRRRHPAGAHARDGGARVARHPPRHRRGAPPEPRLFVVARATAAAHVEDLRALRVDAVVQPEFEGGLEMVRRALAQCDRGEDEIDRLTEALRRGLYDGEPA